MQMRGNNKKMVTGLLLACALGMTGCNLFQKADTAENRHQVAENQEITQDAGEGSSEKKNVEEECTENAEKEPAVTSIAYTDWKIKESLLEGTDNVYELKMDELYSPDGQIMAMEPYGEQVLIMKQTADGAQYFLYLINPLTVELTAAAELPAGIFNPEDLSVEDDGFIRICNMESQEIYIFDGILREVSRIVLPDGAAGRLVLNRERTCIYYVDNGGSGLCCYHVGTGEIEAVFPDDLSNAENIDVTGLLGDEAFLAFCYYDSAKETFFYEIRSIDSGEVVYKDVQAVMDISGCEDAYMLRYGEGAVYEYIYGSGRENKPKVLALKDYAEYGGCGHVCLREGGLVSGVCTSGVEEEYQELTGSVSEEGEAVSRIAFSKYDLETGQRSHAMDFYYVEDGEASVYQCDAVFLKNAECVFGYIGAKEPKWFVWDLTKESSLSGDLQNCVYDWQKTEHPDAQVLAALRERGDEIGRTYGVEIHIGEEVFACPTDIYRYEACNNIIWINRAFDVLEKALAKYPPGMLAELGSLGNGKVQIYLADKILPVDETAIDTSIGVENTIDGITFLVLDINEWGDLENTIYHEIFHVIEQYLNMDETAFFDYEIWDSLNPTGFAYDNDYHINENNIDWSDVAFEMEENAYFIDLYSKSFPGEDRARIMEYAMMDDTDTRKTSLYYDGILQKLRYISEQIRKGFDTSNWPETVVWEEAWRKKLLLE